MSVADPAHRALYARLEEVLGVEPAATLMIHLPPEPASRLATASDLADLGARIDQLFEQIDQRFEQIDRRLDKFDDRFEKRDDRFHAMHETLRDQMRFYSAISVGTMTALTGIFAVVVSIIV